MAKPHYADALRVLVSRIKRELAAGKLLYPCKYFRTPEVKVEGISDLPNITMSGYEDEEESFGAGAKTATNLSTNIVRTEQNLSFLLAFNKEYGPFSDDGVSQLGLMDWISRFKDAVELNDEGCPDLMMDETCVEPLYVSVGDTEVSELSWIVEFRITMFPKPLARGTRALPST